MEQQPIHQNQQPIKMTPPEVVTVKDSLYLTDMLSWNLLAMKKAHFYAQQCQDQEIKAALDKVGMMHQKHYNQILRHLNKQNNQPMGKTQ